MRRVQPSPLMTVDRHRFYRTDDASPHEVPDESSLAGRYFHVFDGTGVSVLEVRPAEKRYRFTIIWNSGNRYESKWKKCVPSGLSPHVLIGLHDLPVSLVLHRRTSGYEYYRPVEREPSTEEVETYPVVGRRDWALARNQYGELLLSLGVKEFRRYFVKASSEDEIALDQLLDSAGEPSLDALPQKEGAPGTTEEPGPLPSDSDLAK